MILRKNKYRRAQIVKLSLLLFSLIFWVKGYAQKLNNDVYLFQDNWVTSFNMGYSQFYGDASNKGYFQKFNGELGFTTGVSGRKMISPAFGVGMNLQYVGLKSTKLVNGVGEPVNFELTGGSFDFNTNGYVDLNNLFWGFKENRTFSMYATLGLGLAFWNTTLYDYDTGFVYKSGLSYGGVKYKSTGLIVPIGVGVNIKVAPNWSVNVEGNLRTVLNDYQDVWNDGFAYDQSFTTTVGVSYYINYKYKSKVKACGCDQKPSKPLEPRSSYNYTQKTPERFSSIEHTGPVEPPAKPKAVAKPVTKSVSDTHSTKGVVYRVQILAKRTRLPDINLFKKKYGLSDDIHENFQSGVYRYSIGYFRNYHDALRYSNVIRGKGVFDAFVVVYRDNVRISLIPDLKK